MRPVSLFVAVLVVPLALFGCGSSKKKAASNPSTTTAPQPGGASGTTPSGQTARLSVHVTPPKAGSPASVTYDIAIATRSGAKPTAAKRITFRAQSGFKLNAAGFPKCSLAALKSGGAQSCAKAKVGGGSAEVITPKGSHLTSRISSFNSGTNGSSTTFLYYVQTPGYNAISAAATVSKLGSGKWGYSISYPPISNALPIAKLTLVTEDKSVTSGGKTVHLIETPASCAGSWKFDSRVLFASGEKLAVSTATPCSS